jgi:hypothetical protein
MTHPYIESPVVKDIKINQGARFYWAFTWKNDDDTIIAVTGKTVTLKISSTYGATPIATWVSPTNITLAATEPTIVVDVPSTSTAPLAAGDYLYDLEIDFGSGDVVRLFQGNCLITPQV